MNVEAKVELANGSRMFFIDNFFEPEMVDYICELFQTDGDHWAVTDQFKHSPGRMAWIETSNNLGEIVKFPKLEFIGEHCRAMIPAISDILGKKVKFSRVDLWRDREGYYLPAHYDQGDVDYGLQIYFGTATTTNPRLGLTIYKDIKTPLYQMVYRSNCGYLVDDAWTVMHGMQEAIEPPYERWSVYARYFDQSSDQ
jgi:hypothetical protein